MKMISSHTQVKQSNHTKSSADSIATTRRLLDSSIVLACQTVQPKCHPPALTCTRWIWRLAGAYHSSRHTSKLMKKAAQKFAASGRHNLAQWASQKAIEEAGHDKLALLDIQSMGYDANAVVQALVPSLVNYLAQSVDASDPIDCVGHSYASERPGTFKKAGYIDSIEALLPPGIYATRWLRVHTAVGAEVQHIEDTVAMVTELDLPERQRIAQACYETALIRFSAPQGGYISDEELQHILKPLKLSQDDLLMA
jgi:hypothetical protein